MFMTPTALSHRLSAAARGQATSMLCAKIPSDFPSSGDSGEGPSTALAQRRIEVYGHKMILLPAASRVLHIAAAMMILAGTASAQGQDPTPLGQFGDWAAYTYKTSAGKVCYVVATPQGSEPKS